MRDRHLFEGAWFGMGRLESSGGRHKNRHVDLLARGLWQSQQLPAADLMACRYLSQQVAPENREPFLFFLLAHYTAFRRGSAFFPCMDAESLSGAYLMYWTPALQWNASDPPEPEAAALWENRESLSREQAKRFLEQLRAGAYRKAVGEDASHPLVYEKQSGTPGIYFQKLYRVEREVSRMLLERLHPHPQPPSSPQSPSPKPHQPPQAHPSVKGDLPDARRSLLTHAPEDDLKLFWKDLSRGGIPLNAEQQAAAALPLSQRISLITGGPGTGKTTVMAAAVLLYCKTRKLSPREVRITAPTGRAAAKLSEGVTTQWSRTYGALPDPAFKGETLHRLLNIGWGSQRPANHSASPLSARLVVVDEASMLDLPLFRQLLAALKPEAHLVLVGDKFQLPSVESGALLGDLSEYYASLAHHVVHLRHTFRFPEAVSRIAEAVNLGDKDKLFSTSGELQECREALIPETDKPGGVYWSCEAVPLRPLMESWMRRRFFSPGMKDETHPGAGDSNPKERTIAPAYGELLSRVRQQDHHTGELDGASNPETHRLYGELWLQLNRGICLSPLRRGSRGADALNREFAELYREQFFGKPFHSSRPGHPHHASRSGISQDENWVSGMPLIITANDYSTGLFNGDMGLMVESSRGLRALMLRRDRYILYPLNQLRSFSPAFCLTVHKSQGGEFEEVLLLTPPEAHPLITRELLYTAVTRSKRWVGIYGQPEALARGMRRRVERFSQLSQWLRTGHSP